MIPKAGNSVTHGGKGPGGSMGRGGYIIASLMVAKAPEAPWEEVGICVFHVWRAVPWCSMCVMACCM